MPGQDEIRLKHMLDAAKAASEFAAGRKREDLANDRQFVFALVRAVEVIGEAASNVSDEFRARYAQLPWRDIVGMRNRLIHAYFDINLDILWSTVQQDIPSLITAIQAILDADGAAPNK